MKELKNIHQQKVANLKAEQNQLKAELSFNKTI